MKQELHLYFEQQSWKRFADGKVKVMANPLSYRDNDMMPIGTVTVTFSDPKLPTEDEYVRFKIGALQEEKQETLVEAQKKVQMIEQQIQELSAITYKPEVEHD